MAEKGWRVQLASLLVDTNNHRVQVFELSGKFVTKFGGKGSETGEFKYTTFTANLQ